MERILIVGGTGTLGSAVARRLLEEGSDVRIMSRRAGETRITGAEVVEGDLNDRESLERACRDVDVVIAAAHSLFGRGDNRSESVDGKGHRDLIDVAIHHHVRRFIYTSVYDFGSEFHRVPFVRIKYECERFLRASGIEFTILRPTAFMEVHAHMLIGAPVLAGKKVPVFGSGRAPQNFIAASDVARVAVEAALRGDHREKTVDIAGPDNLSTMEVIEMYEELGSVSARVTHLPLLVPRVVSRILKPFHPGISQVLQMAVIAQREGQAVDDRAAIAAKLGFDPVPLETWARERITRNVA